MTEIDHKLYEILRSYLLQPEYDDAKGLPDPEDPNRKFLQLLPRQKRWMDLLVILQMTVIDIIKTENLSLNNETYFVLVLQQIPKFAKLVKDIH